jgi:hypothetical protein
MVERVNYVQIPIFRIGTIGKTSSIAYFSMPVSVTLRNPWGYDGAGNDSDPSDGYVTVTAAQANTSFSAVMSAYV